MTAPDDVLARRPDSRVPRWLERLSDRQIPAAMRKRAAECLRGHRDPSLGPALALREDPDVQCAPGRPAPWVRSTWATRPR